MVRLPGLFAMTAVFLLLLGLLLPTHDRGPSLTVTLPRGTYLIPNQLLCFAAALAFCWFAFAYALWFVPWAFRSGMWHFGLSIAAVGAFAISSVVSRHVSALDKVDRAFLPTIFAFCVSPLLFLLIQGFYFADGMHRLWRVLRHASS